MRNDSRADERTERQRLELHAAETGRGGDDQPRSLMMAGAKLLRCSEFGKAITANMPSPA
jgi:hypothetical protein